MKRIFLNNCILANTHVYIKAELTSFFYDTLDELDTLSKGLSIMKVKYEIFHITRNSLYNNRSIYNNYENTNTQATR
jgi:hypothetical protein